MKNFFARLKKILLKVILVYFLMCIFYLLVMWTSSIGSSSRSTNSDHPDIWVRIGPTEPYWVTNDKANNWLKEKWEAPEWTKKK